MGALPKGDYSASEHHKSILQEVLENSGPSDSLIHTYKRSFNGFAANLTENERQKLSNMEDIISVFPSITYKLQTTRSWDFMGFRENVKRVPKVESDVIVGFIDSGVWPESDSFSDEGFRDLPKKWNGSCEGGKNFTCNKKLIGARFYSGSDSARDLEGHGTHTASTAAGNQVNNVSLYGLAKGNVRGAVPSARIAVYKACSDEVCHSEDVMAAFDDAISDGIDILSVSLGGQVAFQYIQDPVSIGSFHAMQNGILTSQSAGNSGPLLGVVASVAPWQISVAASTTDRKIINKIILGDNTTFQGLSFNVFNTTKRLPLVEGDLEDLPKSDILGGGGSVNVDIDYEGKIVYYDGFSMGQEALYGKASGMIVESDQYSGFSYIYPLPTSLLSTSDAKIVKSYIHNASNPIASILRSETLNDTTAPVVASFSSRGPNAITPDILKPDIAAPGTDILAAWSPQSSLSGVPGDKMFGKFNAISGTSMSCPHVTGAAAYVKSFHPDWSPSAIKSALMTTAFSMNSARNPDTELGYGAGHIDPVKAVSPGLVYDAAEADYIKMLCSIYSVEKIRGLTGDKKTTCPKVSVSPKDLNYPSMATSSKDTNFKRTVTNVGTANSTYKATIIAPDNMKIRVIPDVLSFESLNEKKTFVVTVSASVKDGHISSASLVWSDGSHKVRSPIVVMGKRS